MPENMPEKGAAVQKDMESYAIAPYIPGGLVDPATLRKIADVAEKYNVKLIKMNSEHRIGFYGIKEEDIDDIYADLGMGPGGLSGKIFRATKFCIGNTSCKKAYRNTIELGLKIDEKFFKIPTPNKIKISLSGCPNSCAESAVRDIGLIGAKDGWRLLIGGTCGIEVKKGKLMAKNLSDEEVIEIIDRIVHYYKENEEKNRLGKFIDKIGLEKFKNQIME